MSDDHPAMPEDVPLEDEHDDPDEPDPGTPEAEITDEVRERRLRETVDDESAQRHGAARESANPDDHRDEAPNNG